VEYVTKLVEVFREMRRVLRDDGTLWLNLGDGYAGGGGYAPDAPCNERRANGESWGAMNPFSSREGEARKKTRPGHVPSGLKPKDLMGIPWHVAFGLQADGWYLRSDIIWHKPSVMPESVTDRPTRTHEYIFLFAKQPNYYYDAAAIAEKTLSLDPDHDSYRPNSARIAEEGRKEYSAKHAMSARSYAETRNKRSVWSVTTQPYNGAHFATFPPALIEPCILAGCPEGGTVLDPFAGAGTTGLVADRLRRSALLIELNPAYAEMAQHRIVDDGPLFADVATGVPEQQVLL
jgi:DNA modification methylase